MEDEPRQKKAKQKIKILIQGFPSAGHTGSGIVSVEASPCPLLVIGNLYLTLCPADIISNLFAIGSSAKVIPPYQR
jgi:hypothetical protein